jgi:hypothetical protein
VEVVNLYSKALLFEPIHRVLYGVEEASTVEAAFAALPGAKLTHWDNAQIVCDCVRNSMKGDPNGIAKGGFALGIIGKNNFTLVEVESKQPVIASVVVEPVLEKLVTENRALRLDYIHGEDALLKLASTGGTAIFMPHISKDGFFNTIARKGPLPRKSFSMGEAWDKRYYMECRAIAK